MSSRTPAGPLRSGAGQFLTTHWSGVLAAGQLPGSEASTALSNLFEAYASPLYSFARRRGHDSENARDLVQGFFTSLLAGNGLRNARPEKGRFRSFLLGAFKHFLSDEADKSSALKRGGGVETISLDRFVEEDHYRGLSSPEATPEQVFQKRWALTVIDRTLRALREEARAAGKEAAFEELKAYLTGGSDYGSYGPLTTKLGMSEGAVRVAVHRLRKKFAEQLRAEVSTTLDEPADTSEELRFLFSCLS